MIGRFSKLGTYRQLFSGKDILRVAIGGLFALTGFILQKALPHAGMGEILILAAVGINGVPIIWQAINGLIKKQINVDELVSIAIVACLISGDYLSAAVVSFVMVAGSLIEAATGESARRAIQALMTISPKDAVVLLNGKEVKKAITDIQIGDLLLVKPGDRIPVDGTVMSGTTFADESSITGEPMPLKKHEGDDVYAGTLNDSGVIHISAKNVGEDSTLGKVIQLVSEAEAHHPESIALIDRYARWFTPTILLCAAIAWAMTGEASRAITVLIVGCPCALILAAPTAVVAAISRAAKAGILVKGGQYLEHAALAGTVFFDKTGTLTEGNPKVEDIIASDGYPPSLVLKQAACVEQNSTHPLARAILNAAEKAHINFTSAENVISTSGLGVTGQLEGCTIEVGHVEMGNGLSSFPDTLHRQFLEMKEKGMTPIVVYQDETPIGVIGVSDHVRDEAGDTIDRLKSLNIKKIGILSGDHATAVNRLAKAIGATDMWSDLKPKDKLDIIERVRNTNPREKVIFVGDGINDAPALASADVGIAMGAKGTQVALETAHIALMNDDISKIPFLISLGRKMVRIIKWNIVLGLIFNTAAVLAGGAGLLTPIMGAVVHNIGSVIVIMLSASIAFSKDFFLSKAPPQA